MRATFPTHLKWDVAYNSQKVKVKVKDGIRRELEPNLLAC